MTKKLLDLLSKLSTEEKEYFLDGLLENLVDLGDAYYAQKFCKILSDYDFLYSKINYFVTQSLIYDYDLVKYVKLNNYSKESLKLIQHAIILSEDVLSYDKDQLASQLWGRLTPQQSKVIEEILIDSKK